MTDLYTYLSEYYTYILLMLFYIKNILNKSIVPKLDLSNYHFLPIINDCHIK